MHKNKNQETVFLKLLLSGEVYTRRLSLWTTRNYFVMINIRKARVGREGGMEQTVLEQA